jgi:hypothetical protein
MGKWRSIKLRSLQLPRISIFGLLANAAALALLGLTSVALAGPILPADIAGDILGSSSSSFSNVFIDTVSPLLVTGGNLSSSSGSSLGGSITGFLYAVYATVTTIVSGSSSILNGGSSVVELIGYVLSTDLNNALLPSFTSSGIDLTIFGGNPSTGFTPENLSFAVNASALNTSATVPEPSAIAVLVTAVAGVAALWRRRELRQGGII